MEADKPPENEAKPIEALPALTNDQVVSTIKRLGEYSYSKELD